MEFNELLIIAVSAIFINNFVLTRFLGICPYIGVSKNMDSAVGMGFAVIYVMTLASMVTWLINAFMLKPSTANIFYIIFIQIHKHLLKTLLLRKYFIHIIYLDC